MKKTLTILSIMAIGILAYSFTTTQKVYGFNGVYSGTQNNSVVNLGWYVQDSYPNDVSTYVIKRNGAYLKTFQAIGYGVMSIQVERGFKSANFSLIRYVNGMESDEYFTTVRK